MEKGGKGNLGIKWGTGVLIINKTHRLAVENAVNSDFWVEKPAESGFRAGGKAHGAGGKPVGKRSPTGVSPPVRICEENVKRAGQDIE